MVKCSDATTNTSLSTVKISGNSFIYLHLFLNNEVDAGLYGPPCKFENAQKEVCNVRVAWLFTLILSLINNFGIQNIGEFVCSANYLH